MPRASTAPRTAIECIGYLRVSTERQAEDVFTSLADQERAIVECAAKHGKTVGAWYKDAGVSGSKVETRPQFQRLIDWCQANPRTRESPGMVLCLNDSRFGRFNDPEQSAAIRFAFTKSHWHVRFALNDDVQDLHLRPILRALEAANASVYLRDLRANSVRGIHGAHSQGFWTTKAPLGYRRAVAYPPQHARVLPNGQAKADGEKVKLVPGPDAEVQLVREMFTRYARGEVSLSGLVRELQRDHVRIGDEVRSWSVPSVKLMLSNHAYLGHIPSGRRTAERMRQGLHQFTAPTHIERNTHPALIDDDTFALVQQRFTEIPLQPLDRRNDYRLRGLVACAYCGQPYVGGGNSRNNKRAPVPFYVDRGGRDKRCAHVLPNGDTEVMRAGCVVKDLFETTVINAVAQHVRGPAVKAAIKRAVDAAIEAPDDRSSTLQALQQVYERALAKRERIVQAISNGLIRHDEAEQQLELTRQDIEGADANRRRVAAAPRGRTALVLHKQQLLAIASDFTKLAANATGPELRALLAPWLQYATFDKVTRQFTLGVRSIPLSACYPQVRGPELEGSKTAPEVTELRVRIVTTGSGKGRFQKAVVA